MQIALRSLCISALLALLGSTLATGAEEAPAPVKTPILYVAVGPHATLFLHGTLHVPDKRITTLTAPETAALDMADELWTEVDFSQDVHVQLMPYIRLPRNRQLDTLLDDDLRTRVQAILKRHGESINTWQRQKPWWLDVYIGLLFAPRATRTEQTIDEILFQEMQKRGKLAGGLETVYEQVRVFDQLGLKEQVALLNETVTRLERDHKNGTNSVEAMIKIYLSGDADELLTEVESYFDFDTARDRALYASMHAKRNVRMLERLHAKAKERKGKTRLVAVGAAHIPGKQGMLAHLRRDGYVIWRVKTATDIPDSREAALARALAELQRQNAGLGFALRSLEDKVDRLRDRMDKTESGASPRPRKINCPPKPGKRRCCPKVLRCRPRRCCPTK